MRHYHPPLSQSATLIEIFREKVLPLVHIFHMPTLMRDYWDAVASLATLDRNREALLFAIYYSTVISMEPEECQSVIGVSRKVALEHYQFAVQQSMARADFLNTQSVTLLQAVVLFLSALRNEDASRRTWSLTALVFHIARAMGLHRDGTTFGLRPMETELRRRLWWHICLLDIRSSEHHGCQPIVQDSAFDTQMPLNINDSDLVYEMAEPPIEREEATEMTFSLVRCEVLRVALKTGYFSASKLSSDQNKEAQTSTVPETMAKDLQERLEERYITYCDSSIPFFKLCMTVARLMVSRIWLVIHYPSMQKSSSSLPATVRDKVFLLAIKVLELSTILITSPEISQWMWHSKTHVQWHAVALVLSEICSRSPSAECDRAWEYANIVYNRWNPQTDKANPWRPIQRLMAKAQHVREIQAASTALSSELAPDLLSDSEFTTHIPQPSNTLTGEIEYEAKNDEFLLESSEMFLDQDFVNGTHSDFESIFINYATNNWIGEGYDGSFIVN